MTWLARLAALKWFAVVAAIAFIAGGASIWRVLSWREKAHQTQAVIQTLHTQWALDKKSYDLGVEFGKAQAPIQIRTRTLIKKVPAHVSAEADRNCVVPVGLVRVYNAAVAQGDLPATGLPDDTPSGVACSALAANDIAIVGQYYEVAEQLKALQQYEFDRIALEEAQ